MKRIYKNNDLAFNLTINNFPINTSLINSIEFKFYTLNNSNYITKTHADIDVYNQIVLQWNELKKLEEGVLFYDYTVSLNDEAMNDGTQDTVTKVMTNYFIVTGIDNINIDNDIDVTQYYTKEEIDEKIDSVIAGTIDLSGYYTKEDVDYKLEGYVEDGDLCSYYTKNEVNELIDGIDIPTQEVDLSNYYKKSETYSQSEVNALIDGVSAGDVDLTNYYTKTEVDEKIPSTEGFITEIPSEYVTDSELNAKGYLTEHQSLDGYAKLTDIPTDYIKSIPSEYITESELTAKGYLTEHQSLESYAKLTDIPSLNGYAKTTDIPTDYIKEIPSEYVTETELTTSLNGYSTTSHTHSEYITEQYDDTELSNRISTLESEITGVSEQITELNNMVV